MAEQYNHSHGKYINYFTQIVWNIDIFLQEDQLMCTKAGFSLVPVPGYLPTGNDLEHTDASQIIQTRKWGSVINQQRNENHYARR